MTVLDDSAALAPGGTLRLGLVRGPQAGLFFVAPGPGGALRGVAAAIGAAIGTDLGLPVSEVVFSNSGECTEALARGALDLAFMPVDPARSALVAFGPAYAVIESTYLVSAASGIGALPEVDRPGCRVIGIADTTTIRAAARSLAATRPAPVRSVDEAVALLRGGAADALALSRDSLEQIAPTVPGSRLLAGGFQRTTVSAAVPPGRPAALAAATTLLGRIKHDGRVARAFDALGLSRAALAP